MKHILQLVVAFLFMGQIHAQVTIGSALPPNKGALLDLKQDDELGANSTRGLGMPRVQLTTIHSLDDIKLGLDTDEHIGLAIYVPNEFENSCPGLYVWTGTVWTGINTDASRAAEFITVNDIDGNTYTAKLFNRTGCTGGTYWFTSNLRTTRYHDGAAVASTTNPGTPMFISDGKSNTWEIYFNENNSVHNTVRTKADISTTQTIKYLEDGAEKTLTQDQFATKFGLMYTYDLAFEGTIGNTAVEKKLCPEGWRLPMVADWIKVGLEMGASDPSAIFKDGAEYFGTNKFVEPADAATFFAPENITSGTDAVSVNVSHPEGWGAEGWRVRKPKRMSEGLLKNAGLDIYPVGRMSVAKPDSNVNTGVAKSDFVTKNWNFGSTAFFLEKANGTMLMWPYRTNPDGSGSIDQMAAGAKSVYVGSSVRCIKVIE